MANREIILSQEDYGKYLSAHYRNYEAWFRGEVTNDEFQDRAFWMQMHGNEEFDPNVEFDEENGWAHVKCEPAKNAEEQKVFDDLQHEARRAFNCMDIITDTHSEMIRIGYDDKASTLARIFFFAKNWRQCPQEIRELPAHEIWYGPA